MSVADLLARFKDYIESRDRPQLARFTAGFNWAMAERSLAPRKLPVADVLKAPPWLSVSPETPLLKALCDASETLHWDQTYDSGDFGENFLARYGWVELFGTRGHFASDVMAGGFLLLGPDVHYPDHHHVAEEIYIALTPGSLWSKDGAAFTARDAGEIIHHPSDIRHAMQTHDQPLIALYLWRGGPLAQKSVISGRDT